MLDSAVQNKKDTRLGAHVSHARLPMLPLAHVCKVDLLCGLPKEKGEEVNGSGRKKHRHP